MAHVLISYSSKRVPLTREIVAFLEGCGLDVWWDEGLIARGDWKPQLYDKLACAAVVVVLWTKEALTSDWVKLEADYASAPGRNMIVHVVADGLKSSDLPDPYKNVQYHSPDETNLILRDVLAVRAGHLLLQFKREQLPVDGILPTMLLQAKYGVVPFIDSEGALTDTVDWALTQAVHAKSPRRAAGRLVHGPGGLGKTRLLIEVAAALREQGWSAGFIALPKGDDTADDRKRYATALSFLIQGAKDNGLLLVMDYAEGRPDEVVRLCAQIQARPAGETRSIRLVLLTRGAGDWWTDLRDKNPAVATMFRVNAGVPGVIAIQDMTSGRQRLDLFWSAFREFAAVLSHTDYPTPPDDMDATRLARLETGEGYDRPLAIQMEALLYLAAATPDKDNHGLPGQLRSLMQAERVHWAKLVGPLTPYLTPHGLRHPEFDLNRALAQVTGLQGVPLGRPAETLFMADTYYSDRKARGDVYDVHANIAKIYGQSGAIAHLEPDLIGEYHVAATADAELIDGCLAWIDARPEADRKGYRRDLLTVLQRATQAEHGTHGVAKATAHLDHVIMQHGQALAADIVDVAINTPGAMAARMEALVPVLDDNTLEALHSALPQSVLQDSSLAMALALVNRTQDADPADRARHLSNLSVRFSALKRLEDALAASEEAYGILRDLCKNQPFYGPDFAASLDTLGACYSALNRREAALAASEQAVGLYRTLYRLLPAVFGPNLAQSLNNISGNYSAFQRLADALEASKEASSILRALYKVQPAVYGRDLANCLGDLGRRYSDLKRFDDARANSEEAVSISRTLYDIQPAVYGPDLARNLINLGATFADLERLEDGLAASEESVGILRALYKVLPAVYGPSLASNFNNLSAFYFAMQRPEDALAASEESVGILLALYEVQPAVYGPDLALSLSVWSDALRALGRPAEAAAATREALVALLDDLTARPARHAGRAVMLKRKHIEASEEAGQVPDMAVLAPVAAILNALQKGGS